MTPFSTGLCLPVGTPASCTWMSPNCGAWGWWWWIRWPIRIRVRTLYLQPFMADATVKSALVGSARGLPQMAALPAGADITVELAAAAGDRLALPRQGLATDDEAEVEVSYSVRVQGDADGFEKQQADSLVSALETVSPEEYTEAFLVELEQLAPGHAAPFGVEAVTTFSSSVSVTTVTASPTPSPTPSPPPTPDNCFVHAGVTVCTRPAADADTHAARPWKVLLQSDATDAELKQMSAEFSGGLQSHPGMGEVPLLFGNLTQDGLKALLDKYPGRVKAIQEDEFIKMVDDPQFDDRESERRTYPWGLQYIQADLVRGRGVGVHVYVLDTGIRITHTEFGGRAFAAVDVAASGTYPGTLAVCSPTSTTCADDVHGHGSHCAGTVGSSSYGVADGATIWSAKVLNNAGSGWTTWMVLAEQWILSSGNRPAVVSTSIQVGPGWTDLPWQASTDALVADGVVVVVAAGNYNQDACTFSPAFIPSAITVAAFGGASGTSWDRASYSNWGSCIDVYAPGTSVLSTGPSSDFHTQYMTGTSMACPHVAGLAARMFEAYPTAGALTAAERWDLLTANNCTGCVTNDATPTPTVNLVAYAMAANPCSVTDGSGPSASYPCDCGTNLCTDGEVCTSATDTCASVPTPSPTAAPTPSPTPSPTGAPTPSCAYALADALALARTNALAHALAHAVALARAHALADTLAYALADALAYGLTNALTLAWTNALTDALANALAFALTNALANPNGRHLLRRDWLPSLRCLRRRARVLLVQPARDDEHQYRYVHSCRDSRQLHADESAVRIPSGAVVVGHRGKVQAESPEVRRRCVRRRRQGEESVRGFHPRESWLESAAASWLRYCRSRHSCRAHRRWAERCPASGRWPRRADSRAVRGAGELLRVHSG
ncbi:unnamed protein product [Prorocentrum cordatum]|uniref:subtilisin n=1 Tax=Prorocentrum cordatum TaxID=2364126 RepID=A0ABN9Y3P6_9DINO|nr:unnamed protein product [Polarella glacialis]